MIHFTGTPDGACERKDNKSDVKSYKIRSGKLGTILTNTALANHIGNVTCPVCKTWYENQPMPTCPECGAKAAIAVTCLNIGACKYWFDNETDTWENVNAQYSR